MLRLLGRIRCPPNLGPPSWFRTAVTVLRLALSPPAQPLAELLGAIPCADECTHPLCRQVGGGMHKETTLHSFEVHQKLATLSPLFTSTCTAIHRSMTRNCARVSRGCAYEAGAGVIFPRYSLS